MERRSASSAKVRMKYTNDAFEGIGELDELRSDEGIDADATDSDSDAKDRFEEPDEPSSDDNSSSDVREASSGDDSAANEQPEDTILEDLIPVSALSDKGPLKRARPRGLASQGSSRRQPLPKTLHTRGLSDKIEGKISKVYHMLHHFGASSDDQKAMDAAKRKWMHNPTLPSRAEDQDGFGGMRDSFIKAERSRSGHTRMDNRVDMKDDNRSFMSDAQVLEPLDQDLVPEYMPEKRNGDASVLMGPRNAQIKLKFKPGQRLPLIDAWKSDENSSNVQPEFKRGFLLHLGSKVRCLDWAPNRGGLDQYLAVVVPSQHRTANPTSQATESPAFSPKPASKSNVQIWRFRATTTGTVDVTYPPRLVLVLCTEWGDVKMLKWCPATAVNDTNLNNRHLGSLAGVWADGTLRILDITVPEDGDETRHVYVKRAAFESKPPDTVCTCLTWISSTELAAGCANGCIAVWNLSEPLPSGSSNRRPMIYSCVSSTYILSLVSCYPSRPYLLLIGSMTGSFSTTDLSRSGQSLTSQASTVPGSRARMGLPLLIWHEFGQTAIHADDNTSIKGSALRRLFANMHLARGESNATSLASSPLHPTVLVGCANGDVFATNPLNRIVEAQRSETWQQIWFTHEWRRPAVEAIVEDRSAATLGQAANDSNGICRFTEGFKAELVALAGEARGSKKHNRHKGTAYTTIYEEKSAITVVAWNPNLHVGGWAAAGMGDGLLRVEDISI